VSLPQGVFNPYSPVKTSILILDKQLNKKTDKIFFAKVENDGFSLGKKRQEIDKNDLPRISKSIKKYCDSLKRITKTDNLNVVSKYDILNSDDIGLSYERYQKTEINSGFDNISLENYIELTRGVTFSKNQTTSQSKKGILRAQNIDLYKSKLNLDDLMYVVDDVKTKDSQKLNKDDIFICLASGSKTHIGKVAYVDKDYDYFIGGFMGIIRCSNLILPKYLYFNLSSSRFNNYLAKVLTTTSINNLTKKLLYGFQIPLPPLDVQKEIIVELDQYQKVIDGAQQVVDNYKPHFEIDESWEKVELQEIVTNVTDSVIPQQISQNSVKYIGLENIQKYRGTLIGEIDCDPKSIKSSKRVFKKGDILFGKLRPNLNKVCLAEFNGICSTDILVFRMKESHKSEVYHSILFSNIINKEVLKGITGSQLPRTSFNHMKRIKVPIIPLGSQKQIVERLELERKIVESNKKLIEIYSKKIEDRINKIWGE
jgi:type I restriction enzyme M protein